MSDNLPQSARARFQLSRWQWVVLIVGVVVGVLAARMWWTHAGLELTDSMPNDVDSTVTSVDIPAVDESGLPVHPLMISELRKRTYPGSEITVEETLPAGSNYQRYLVSYVSEGNKIYALMTIPNGEKPASGWPVIVFNHGYIPPEQYRTTERYVAYVDGFARRGYIVFKSDYRGHGSSEGEATGGYGTPDYTVDILNAVASLKKHPDVDSQRLGMWGHSMGGQITLRSMVINSDIKAGAIWAGVVASYPDLLNNWRRSAPGQPTPTPFPVPSGARRWRQVLTETYGSPEANPAFWNSISPNHFVGDISGPVQIHHATGDTSVPYAFSQNLEADLRAAGKPVELYIYQGDDHNLSRNFGQAMSRSVEFFDRYLKS